MKLFIINALVLFVLSFAIIKATVAQDNPNANTLKIESLKIEIGTTNDESQKSKLCNDLGMIYLNQLPDSAIHFARLAQKIALKYNQKEELARSSLISGNVFYNQGFFNSSIENLIKSLQYYREIENEKGQAEVHQDLGLAYQYSKKSDVALENYNKSLKLFQKIEDNKGIAGTLAYIGHVYEKKLDYDEALRYQEEALQIYEKLDDKEGLAKVMDNIGSIYEDLENYEEAFRYFSLALEYNKEANNQVATIIDLNNIGDVYQKQGKYKESLTFTFRSLELARRLNQKYQLRSAYRDIAQTYQLLGDFNKGYAYLDSSYIIYGEIYNLETAQQIAGMQVIYEMQEKDKEISLLESSDYFNRILLFIFSGGIMILISLGLVIFNRQRLLIIKNKQIIEQNTLIYEAERKLQEVAVENMRLNELNLKAEIENKQLKEERLQDELDIKNRELTGRALLIVQKNEILYELRENIHIALQKKDNEREKELKKLISLIEKNTQLEKDWNEFKLAFEQVHGNFFSKLQEKFSDLTSGDLRLCALLRLNLNSKDIATTMGISHDSLRVSRYRLRKKMNLNQGENLVNFMMGI